MKKKITKSYIFHYSWTKMCFLRHINFPVRWLRALFHNMKVRPQFLFQGREARKVCSCHLATFNRKEKNNACTLHKRWSFFFFGLQCNFKRQYSLKFLLPTFIICQRGGEANYCYISFIQKTILPLPYVYVYKKTFYKERSEFFCLFGTH